MGINIKNYTLTKSPCYTSGRTINVKGLYLHSVGCPCEKAANILNNMNRSNAGAGVHACLQPDGTVLVGLPTYPSKGAAIRNWHGGSGKNGSCNNTHIGIEMTEPSTIKYTGGGTWVELSDGSNTKAVVLKNYRNAVEYFAYLCKAFSLNPLKDGVILSHSEGYRRGYATNHGDVEHIWKYFGITMDQFRNDVKKKMSGGDISITGTPDVTDSNKQKVNPLNGTLTIIYEGSDGICVRSTPSFGDNVVKVVKKNACYTVTGISQDEKWYRVQDAGKSFYITTIPKYVKFKATAEQKESTAGTGYFRVRKSWDDAGSQIGAFKQKENAVNMAKMNSGYIVFDNSGNIVYPTIKPTSTEYKLKVTTPNLRIRKGPGTTYDYHKKNGSPLFTGPGTFTIVEEKDGPGASRWGLLKAYADNRNGWISLDYGEKCN